MNDIHDSAGFPAFSSTYKQENPHLLIGTESHKPYIGYWSGVCGAGIVSVKGSGSIPLRDVQVAI